MNTRVIAIAVVAVTIVVVAGYLVLRRNTGPKLIANARYVRLEAYSQSANMIFNELEVFSNNTNVALEKVATQSSCHLSDCATYGPPKGINGNLTDRVETAGNQTNPWYEVDLGSVLPIHKIRIHPNSSQLNRLSAINTYVILMDANRTVVKTYKVTATSGIFEFVEQ